MKQNTILYRRIHGEKKLLSVFSGILALWSVQGYSQACTDCLPHTDPNNTGNWEIQQDFSDEFNNGTTLDDNKWLRQGENGQYANNWKGRNPSQFIPESITQDNGILTIKSDWNPSFDFDPDPKFTPRYGAQPITTGALVSKKFVEYGYLEIKSRVGKSPMSGSFWTVDEDNVGELDVFEHVGQAWDSARDNADYPTVMQSSFHTWNQQRPQSGESNRVWTNTNRLEFDVTEAFHIYSADWTSEYVRLYVDGKLIKEITKDHAESIEFGPVNAWCVNTEMRVWIDCEIFDWVGDLNKLEASMFGDEAKFEVDYVRVWKRGAGGSTEIAGQGENLVTNSNFADNIEGWDITGTSTHVNYKTAPAGAWLFWKSDNDNEDDFCLQIGGGETTAEQTVSGLKPNTSYLLTSQLRMPGTTGSFEPANQRPSPVIWQDGYFGVKDFGGADVERKIFLNWFQSYGIQFSTGASSTSATIYFSNAGDNGAMNIDNVRLVELTDLSNTNAVLSINDNANLLDDTNNIVVYPSPAAEQTHVMTPKGADISIIQLNGSVVASKTATSEDTSFELNNVSTGMYLVKVELDGVSVVKRLIKK